MPGNGKVAEPGLRTVRAGSGVMRMWPVSVCHQVSTTGQRPPPMIFQYQTHASGLIGSPTEPSSLRLERSQRLGYSSPHFMNVRIVGCALVHHRRGPVGQRPVDNVGVTGHPADVGRAPVHVVVLDIEDPPV